MKRCDEIVLSPKEAEGILKALTPGSAEHSLLAGRLHDFDFGRRVMAALKTLLPETLTMEEARIDASSILDDVSPDAVPEEEVERVYDGIIRRRAYDLMTALNFAGGKFSWRPLACPEYIKDSDSFLVRLGELVSLGETKCL